MKFLLILALLVPIAPTAKITPGNNFRIMLTDLYCDKTTEAGADEVYILIVGQSDKGRQYCTRVPSNSTHWDMNDNKSLPNDNPNGDSHGILYKKLFESDIAPGENWNFTFLFCEEDGGKSPVNLSDLSSAVLSKSGNPYLISAGALIKILKDAGLDLTNLTHDTDDWMGCLGIRVFNNNGDIQVTYNKKEGIIEESEFFGRKSFRMNHDGSNYLSVYTIDTW